MLIPLESHGRGKGSLILENNLLGWSMVTCKDSVQPNTNNRNGRNCQKPQQMWAPFLCQLLQTSFSCFHSTEMESEVKEIVLVSVKS